MHGMKWIGAAALVAVIAVPTFAGEGKKCSYGTQECLDHMAVKMKSNGWIGVEIDVNETSGVYEVTKIVDDSPAQAAGLKIGDVLFALNGIEIAKEENQEALQKVRAEMKPGSSVTYTVKSDGTDREVKLTLAPMPADVLARYVGQHMLEHAAAIEDKAEETVRKN